jgi:hypothetical protein
MLKLFNVSTLRRNLCCNYKKHWMWINWDNTKITQYLHVPKVWKSKVYRAMARKMSVLLWCLVWLTTGVLGSLVVACLVLDPSFAGSNPAVDGETFKDTKHS